jgi:hypothetical protein
MFRYCDICAPKGPTERICDDCIARAREFINQPLAQHLSAAGKKGGSVISLAKAAAVRENGKKGGRPKGSRA